MSIIYAFLNGYKRMEERGWEQIYVFVDIHGTILIPDYGKHKKYKFYPDAKKTLQYLSKMDSIMLGLYTCSYPEDIDDYLEFFKNNKINFELVNENHREKNTPYANFTKKPYFNVLIDDKAGFNPYDDWIKLKIFCKRKLKLK